MPEERIAPALPAAGSRPTLVVVVPCYDEADGIQQFHAELKRVLGSLDDLDHRIVYVDDGSRDATLARLEAIAAGDATALVYSLSRNFGHQIALSAGLDVADGDAVVMMDADLQHPPAVIPQLVAAWRSGSDVVSTIRETTADATLLKRFTSWGFYWLVNRLSDTPIVHGAADFCLLSRRAHQALLAMPERHRFLRGMVSWIGFQRSFVRFAAASRVAGVSKYTMVKMVRMAFDAMLSFSAVPMRSVSRVGLAIVSLGVAYLAYVLGRYLLRDDLVPGWASLIAVVVVMGGLQLIGIGMLGEYLARVFEQTKGRPLYFFKRTPTAPHRGGAQ